MTQEITKKPKSLLSCEISLNYLRRAKDAGIDATFLRMDTHYLPFEDDSFDCVVITEVMEHLYSPYRVLEEIHRVMGKNGILILSVPNQMFLPNIIQHLINKPVKGHDLHLSYYDPHALVKLLNFVGFSVLNYKTAFFYIPPFKPLFSFHVVQEICVFLFKNFGDKIIVKAEKSDRNIREDR